MRLSMIVAMDLDRVIGKNGGLPWRLPADLKYFRKVTMAKPIIMGRTTFESIGRPLPGRANIVLTKRNDYEPDGCLIVHSVAETLALIKPPDEWLLSDARAAGLVRSELVPDEALVIGGAQVYCEFFPFAERLYITLVHGHFAGDTHFPTFDRAEWQEVKRIDYDPDAENPSAYSFIEFDRIRKPADDRQA
ncbi:MAG: dihydrofolate reductase [Planctomycetota bacterium]